MITAEPSASNTELGWPLTSEIMGLAISTVSSPLAGMYRLGMSPACDPSAASMPCFLLAGLKCPPALVKGGSHLPTAWTWKACSPAGTPFTVSLSRTPCGVCSSATCPTSLPLVSFSDALAVWARAESDARLAAASTARLRKYRPTGMISPIRVVAPSLLQHLGWPIERKTVERSRPLMVRHLVEVGLAVVVQPTIDPERDTGDIGGRLAQQVDDGAGDLGLCAMTLHRDSRPDVAQHVVGVRGIAVEARGGDEAGQHRIDAHPGMRPLDRRGVGEVGLSGACRAVMAHAGHAELPVGADIDDGAAVAFHPAAVDFLGHQEGRGHVVGDHGVPAVQRDILELGGKLPARIVDQPVDAAAPGEHALDRFLELVLPAQVGREGESVGIVELLLHLVEFLRRAPDQGDARAQRSQFMRGAAAEPRAAAGDDDGLAGEQAGTEDRMVLHARSTRS